MVPAERIDTLLTWTPFLAEGLLLNLLISVASVLLGTAVGFGIARLRLVRFMLVRWSAEGTTSVMRNVPSFILLFFIAFLIPREFTIDREVYSIPSWIKATIALAIPVIAFVADQATRLNPLEGAERHAAKTAFLVSWVQYFLIIFMASSTASVIGVPEMVSRANTVIAAVRDPGLILWIYSYVALWFIVAGALFSGLQSVIAKRLHTENPDLTEV